MIPLTRPWMDEHEARAAREVLLSGQLVQGPRVAELEALVAGRCGRQHAVAVSSGTAALQLALRAIGVGPGDEVLLPALTWPSPAHAIVSCGATPVLVDVDPDEWNAGAEAFAAARTARTAAAVVIDQLGNPARRAEIEEALEGLPLLEDAACALGSHFPDGPCGSLGRISCLSFHPRKIVTTGEGGMCLTDDDALAEALRALRNHGQVAPGVFREVSGNHRMAEVAAAIGVVQMGRLDAIIDARHTRAQRYVAELTGVSCQRVPVAARASYQTFGALLPEGATAEDRDRVLHDLEARGVQARRLTHALHRIASVAQHATVPDDGLPRTESIADRGLALPLFPTMTDDDQMAVIEAVRHATRELETS